MKEGRSEGGREGRRPIALNMFNKTGRISKIILEKRKYDKKISNNVELKSYIRFNILGYN